MRERITSFGKGQRSLIEVEAVKHLDLDVKNGTVLGVIGANGAGKSTLMKALAGLLPPTEGEIEVNGKVSALLSLGIGFNANFSGRDNVILGGLAAGMTRAEIEDKFDEIVEFSELANHIEMPMRTYSAGMYSRLAFAVSTTIQPEILIIDEALSAGDAHFKEKSAERIKKLSQEAKTLVIVSHSLGTIQELCTDVLWLDHGKKIRFGKPLEVTSAYTEFLNVGLSPETMEDF